MENFSKCHAFIAFSGTRANHIHVEGDTHGGCELAMSLPAARSSKSVDTRPSPGMAQLTQMAREDTIQDNARIYVNPVAAAIA